jgi:beta-glucosidase
MYSVIVVSEEPGALRSVETCEAGPAEAVFNHAPSYNEFFTPEMEAAVESVLAEMTIDEKLKMVCGDIEGRGPKQRGSASVDRVGIGTMVFYNGPRGYQMSTQSTHFPCGTGQAASFRPELLEQIGGAIARELLSDGIQVLEAPSINIIRDPLNGRNFEYFTEDPVLNGAMTAAFVRGGQRAGAVTTAKHFIANNKETNRNQVNEVVGERALREIYLPGFKAACDAGVMSLMTGANRVNGPHASDNPALISILKKEWGWPGFLYTDWNGVQTTEPAFNAGLDLSMPGQPNGPFNLKKLRDAFDAGRIDENTADDKVRRLLRAAYFAGKLKGAPEKPSITVDVDAHHKLAYETALAGMTLVRNEQAALPITDKDKTIAVLGPLADKRFSEQTGGSSGVRGVPYDITARAGLEKRFGSGRLNAVPFSMDDVYEVIGAPTVFHLDSAGKRVPGFAARYSGKDPVTLEPAAFETTADRIEFNWEMTSPDRELLHADGFHAVWSGKLIPPVSGNYTLRLNGSQIVYLSLDGEVVMNKHFIQRDREQTLFLEAGREYDISLSLRKLGGDSFLQFSWIRPDRAGRVDEIIQQSVDAAKQADVALVFVGLDHNTESEGMDRFTMRLPEYHDRLVEAVRAANPRTVVVAYCGTPIAMDPWFETVPAVVLPWFPGIENGNALAAVLSGDEDFGGRLPITFPKKYEDSPAHPARQPGVDKHDTIEHNEGIFVGYRWFDEKQIEPLIPFGHGLSYTTFEYSNLTVDAGGFPVKVQVDVKNSGKRDGVEVVQLYVQDLESSLPRPPRELKGFQSIALRRGETKTVRFELCRDAFSFYSPQAGGWVLEPGGFTVLIGRSSRNTVLQQPVVLPHSNP